MNSFQFNFVQKCPFCVELGITYIVNIYRAFFYTLRRNTNESALKSRYVWFNVIFCNKLLSL